ncbi:MAG: hypothetical protein KC731_00820 [Myxococcales bacterium]|nr:hypothetical protein [Myxococcales bacterium]
MFQPSWFTDLQSFATLVVVVVAVGLALWGRARDRDGVWWQAVAIGGSLFGFIWIPATYLDVAFGVLVGLIAILGADSAIGHVAAIVVGVVAAFTVHAMPGGIATLLALGACLMAVITGVRAGRFLRRIRRAARLSPEDQRPVAEVEVGGRLPAEEVSPPPGFDAPSPMGAWRLSWPGGSIASPRPMILQAPEGKVVVQLDEVEIRVGDHHQTRIEEREAQALAEALDDGALLTYLAEARDQGISHPVTLHWLPPAQAVHLLGRPSWRKHAGASYRDGELLPSFEGGGELVPTLVDQSRGEHGRALTWDLVRALGWGAAAAAVAASHLLA